MEMMIQIIYSLIMIPECHSPQFINQNSIFSLKFRAYVNFKQNQKPIIKFMTDTKTQTKIQRQRNMMKQMVLRVLGEKSDWQKHLNHTCCKCDKCNCGKHLCKYQPIHLDTKLGQSIYHQDYNPKKKMKTEMQEMPKTIQKHNNQRLINKSAYGMDYSDKKGDTIEHGVKMKGNLEIGGPLFANTIYQETFQRKPNQTPQKPLKNLNYLGTSGMKFTNASNYQNAYKWTKNPQSTRKGEKKKDNLKTEPSIFRSLSSYQQDYVKLNNKSFAAESYKPHDTYAPTNGILSKSAYRREYYDKGESKCPASRCC